MAINVTGKFELGKEYNLTPNIHGAAGLNDESGKFQMCGTYPTLADFPDPYDQNIGDCYKCEADNNKYWWTGEHWEKLTDGVVLTDIDAEMSDTSLNPVENKVIKEYVDDELNTVVSELSIMTYDNRVNIRGLNRDRNIITNINLPVVGASSDTAGILTINQYNAINTGISDNATAIADIQNDISDNNFVTEVEAGTNRDLVVTKYDGTTSNISFPYTNADRGLNLDATTHQIGHANTMTPINDQYRAVKIKTDEYGHITDWQNLTQAEWKFTLDDGTTITRHVYLDD